MAAHDSATRSMTRDGFAPGSRECAALDMQDLRKPVVSRLETFATEGGQVTNPVTPFDDSLTQRARDAIRLHDAPPGKGVGFE